jgi:hypothetical protein
MATTDPKLIERRRKMLRCSLGGDITTCVKRLAREYGVTESALWRDWQRRSEWLGSIGSLDDPIAAAKKLLAEKELVREEAWRIFQKAEENRRWSDNTNGMVGALNLVNRTIDQEIELLQSLGQLQHELGKLETAEKIVVNIERLKQAKKKAGAKRAEIRKPAKSVKPEKISVNVTPVENPGGKPEKPEKPREKEEKPKKEEKAQEEEKPKKEKTIGELLRG